MRKQLLIEGTMYITYDHGILYYNSNTETYPYYCRWLAQNITKMLDTCLLDTVSITDRTIPATVLIRTIKTHVVHTLTKKRCITVPYYYV